MHIKPLAAALGLAATLALPAAPAMACLSCGCGGSGVSADQGAIGGASTFFSMGHQWLFQQGVSLRGITGSLNERGDWSPTPVDGSLLTLQGSFGITYFPTVGSSLGIQLPAALNSLEKATWGPLGSVNPTDLARATGGALGDIAVQGSYKVFEAESFALAGFAGATVPTGQATGDPQNLTGAGVANGLGGLMAVWQGEDWELTGSLGLQRPFGRPALAGSTFYIGDAWLYQVQGGYRFNDAWRVGLGLSGYAGEGRFGTSDTPFPMAKLKLIPSLQYAFDLEHGVRLAAGYDPVKPGLNSMTDLTAYVVFYQFMH